MKAKADTGMVLTCTDSGTELGTDTDTDTDTGYDQSALMPW
jgi:hypothetical protein